MRAVYTRAVPQTRSSAPRERKGARLVAPIARLTSGRLHALIASLAAALMVIAGLVVADHYYSHGLDATYFWQQGDARVMVHRTVEHRVSFASAHRPLSRYIQNWDFATWGIPGRTPPIDVVLEGTLEVPEGPPRWITVEGSGQTIVEIDGRRALAPVVAGTHRILIRWASDPDKTASMKLRWAEIPSWDESIPRGAFTPRTGRWPPERTWVWVGGVGFASLLALALFLALGAPEPKVRSARLERVALALIVVVGLALRLWDYDVVPEFRENKDELYATWNGWSILEDGTTRGWTAWAFQYGGNGAKREKIRYFSDETSVVVSPYFEHPPLMHVLVGAAAHLGGADHWSHARLRDTRWVPILLSVLTIGLVYAVGRRLDTSSVPALFGAALYAAIPLIAIQNRAIKEEALMQPLVLGGLWFFLRWRDEGEERRDLVIAAILCGLCALVKVPGIAFGIALVLLVAQRGRWRQAGLVLAIVLGLASLFLIEGALINWDLFVDVQQIQSTIRGTFWNVFIRFIHMAFINHNVMGRGWLLFLWIGWAAAAAVAQRDTRAVIVMPLLLYVVAMGLSAGFWSFGWYWLPFFPFLCIACGQFLRDLWHKPDLFRGFVLIGVLVMYSMNYSLHPDAFRFGPNFDWMRRMISIFSIGFLAPYVLAQLLRDRPFVALARLGTTAALIVALSMSTVFVYGYEHLCVTHENFDIRPGTDR